MKVVFLFWSGTAIFQFHPQFYTLPEIGHCISETKERKREGVCVCVCVCEKEREKKRGIVCVCERERERL